jgi:hypothetical protein
MPSQIKKINPTVKTYALRLGREPNLELQAERQINAYASYIAGELEMFVLYDLLGEGLAEVGVSEAMDAISIIYLFESGGQKLVHQNALSESIGGNAKPKAREIIKNALLPGMRMLCAVNSYETYDGIRLTKLIPLSTDPIFDE